MKMKMFLPLIVVKGEFSQKLWMAKNFNSRISTKKTHNEYKMDISNRYSWVTCMGIGLR